MRSPRSRCNPLLSPTLMVALAMMAPPALAQTAAPAALQPRTAPSTPSNAYPLVHVNPSAGSDTSGDGSQLRPYQTITHALRLAPVNSIVLLAPGHYSEASGERFPIQLRPGVTVQGSPNGALGQTVIRGSGIFVSTTAGLVQTTLVGADGAGLGHVMVTNTSTAGYGLVIEAGRPTIRQNQFVGSGYGGVYVSGDSAPVLEGNQFSRNGVVGLVLSGRSAAEVRGNRFEQTGIGIRVAPGAQPQIINNTIVQNQEGLLLDGSASPVLQDNVIAQNRRNGVVEFQTALKVEASAPEAILPTASAMPPALLNRADSAVPFNSQIVTEPPPPGLPQVTAASPWPQVPPGVRATPEDVVSPVVSEAPRAAVPDPESLPPAAIPQAPVPQAPVATTSQPLPEALPLRSSSPASELPSSAPPATSTATPAAIPPVPAEPPATETIAIAIPVPAAAAIPDSSALARAAADLPSIPVSASQEPGETTVNPAQGPTAVPSSTQPTTPNDTVLAARETLRRWRLYQESVSRSAADTAAADTASAVENAPTEAAAIPIAVIPPPADTVARANDATPRPALPPASMPSVRPPAPAQTNALPASPDVLPRNPDLLPVPDRRIPQGSGGSTLPTLAPPATTLALNGAPPAPPSHRGLLGLVYTVVVPAADATTQAQVRAVVADAFRINLNGQTMMQVGAYADEATATAKANELLAQGLNARVEYRP